MKLGHKLNLNQVQKLSMTPQLQQAIKILQFNSIELNEYIKGQIEENPLLESINIKEGIKETNDYIDEYKGQEIDWKEYIKKNNDIIINSQMDKNEEELGYENFITYLPSLKEHLLEQLGVLHLNEELKFISKYIIENLDENGYLKINLSELSSLLNINIEIIQEALETVKMLDPIGVGAADLKECLLIQIEAKGITGLVKMIVTNHLQDLGENRIIKISRELGVSMDKVQQAIDYIRTLEPKPGRVFNNHLVEDVQFIIPEVSIEVVDETYNVRLSETAGPRLNINNFYKDLIENDIDRAAEEFITDKLKSAIWIIKSIEQRRSTIKKVVESILKYQKEFFDKGEKHLRPLTFKMVAEDIGVHESTISRVVNEKYVQTPRGIFELRYFFTKAVITSGGKVSSTNIKLEIADIIDGENFKKPYSDQKIVDILKERGKPISRRTVAKYREELQIPSSTKRKRFD